MLEWLLDGQGTVTALPLFGSEEYLLRIKKKKDKGRKSGGFMFLSMFV